MIWDVVITNVSAEAFLAVQPSHRKCEKIWAFKPLEKIKKFENSVNAKCL